MQAVSITVKIRKARQERLEVTTGEPLDLKLAIAQFFRPCVLSFFALAIVVGGWGYGYKLCKYLEHSDVGRASATRMLVEHRDDSFKIQAHQNTKIEKPVQFHGFLSSIPRIPQFYFSRDLVLAPAALVRITDFISPLNCLRAPPVSQSHVA